jgi:hypothetical protein
MKLLGNNANVSKNSKNEPNNQDTQKINYLEKENT